MGLKPRWDAEQLMMDVKSRLINEYNDILKVLIDDKARDSDNIVLTDFAKLGGGNVGEVDSRDPGVAIDVIGMNRDKMQVYNPYIFVQFVGSGINLMESMGQQEVEIAIVLTMIDPYDYTGEIRMLRYVKGIEMLFEPMSGKRTGIASLTGVQVLPYLSGPDYWDSTKTRLTWGLGLKFYV